VNDNLLVVVMLESPLAIENADAIAAVPGIDVLLIGTSDLTLEMRLPGQLMHPDVVKAYETVIAACNKHGKWAGMGGVYTDEGLTKYIALGIKMVLAGNDMSYLMQSAVAREKHLRALKA
jgi:2-keto-3-deoxy-L-rhamnonate aldolase RhmA